MWTSFHVCSHLSECLWQEMWLEPGSWGLRTCPPRWPQSVGRWALVHTRWTPQALLGLSTPGSDRRHLENKNAKHATCWSQVTDVATLFALLCSLLSTLKTLKLWSIFQDVNLCLFVSAAVFFGICGILYKIIFDYFYKQILLSCCTKENRHTLNLHSNSGIWCDQLMPPITQWLSLLVMY